MHAAHTASKRLQAASGFDVEDLAVDVFTIILIIPLRERERFMTMLAFVILHIAKCLSMC